MNKRTLKSQMPFYKTDEEFLPAFIKNSVPLNWLFKYKNVVCFPVEK